MTVVMSQAEVEEALLSEAGHLEALTNGGHSAKVGDDVAGYGDLCDDAAAAEVDWKVAQARSLLALESRAGEGRREPEYLRMARVLALHEDLYRSYKMTAAAKEAHYQALGTSKTRIEALRTIAANVRAQT